MLKKIGKAFVYLYVTLPLKGIAGNLGYKHLKMTMNSINNSIKV